MTRRLAQLLALLILGLLAPGCGDGDKAETAATPAPPVAEEEHAAAEHDFEPGHSKAVREYYGVPHSHGGTDEFGETEAEYHMPPHPASGGLGDTIVLTGINLGVRMAVKVTAVTGPVRAARAAPAGKRYVGIRLRMKNTGVAIFESTLREAVVTDDRGRRARVVTELEAGCSNGLQTHLRIDVGDRAAGCLLFALPAGRRPQTLELALEQVPAAAGGRWSLR